MWDHRQNKHGVSKIIDTFAMYQTSLLLQNFLLYNSPDPLRSVCRFLVVFLFRLVSARVCFQFRAIMSSANNNEGRVAARSCEKKSILVGAINTGRAFSHNMQGPIPPALDLDSFPEAKEAIRVTEDFCDNYRALRKEVEILQEETCRLRRMLEIFLDLPSSSSSNNPFETL